MFLRGCPGHLAFMASLPQLSGAFRKSSLHPKGVGCKYLCTWYNILHEVFAGPQSSMCAGVCVVVCMYLGHTVRCCLPSSHNLGRFTGGEDP